MGDTVYAITGLRRILRTTDRGTTWLTVQPERERYRCY